MTRLAVQRRCAIGLVLLVPLGSFAEMRPVRAAAAKASRDDGTTRAPGPPAARCVHVVRRGESLIAIATRHRVPRQSIITANHPVNADALRVGWRLQIPGCKAAPVRRGAEWATAVISHDGPMLVARVGPRRIPTSLYMAVPEFHGGPVFQWPIEGPVLSAFGRRPGGWHAGIDIKGDVGAPIWAAAAGAVTVSTWEATYGYVIKIRHPGNITTVYAHNLKNLVEVGDEVSAGAVIATVGQSGRASAFHVHFEVRKAGMAYNPLYVLEAADAPVLASDPGSPPHDDGPRD